MTLLVVRIGHWLQNLTTQSYSEILKWINKVYWNVYWNVYHQSLAALVRVNCVHYKLLSIDSTEWLPIKCSLCSSDCLNTSRQMMFAYSSECLSAYCCFYSVTPYTPSFHRVSPRAAVRGRNHWTTQSLHQPTSRSINQSISLTISCFVSALAEKKLGRSPTIRLSRRVKKQPLSRPVIGTTLLPPLLVGVRGPCPSSAVY